MLTEGPPVCKKRAFFSPLLKWSARDLGGEGRGVWSFTRQGSARRGATGIAAAESRVWGSSTVPTSESLTNQPTFHPAKTAEKPTEGGEVSLGKGERGLRRRVFRYGSPIYAKIN